MYSITVSGGAYALLISNLVATVILLKKQFKQWRTTSLYILSISDMLFSVLTSSILFMNYMEIYADYNKWNDILFSNNSVQNQENNNSEIESNEFKRFHKTFGIIANENNFTTIPECHMTNVIMEYGMLFFPFTNSFVSLLVFSVQCNLNVFSLKCRCLKFQPEVHIEGEVHVNDKSVSKSELQNMNKYKIGETSKVQSDSRLQLIKQKNFSSIERCKKKFLQAFKDKELKKDNKIIVSILVISQWIVPILVTGLLYLAEYDTESNIEDVENIGCFNGNIFFDNCNNNTKFVNMTKDIYSEMYSIPFYKDYINNKDLVRSPNSNSTQINEIVSKVQNIVHSILNNTHNISHVNQMTFYNTSELENITKQLDGNAHINTKQNNTRNIATNLTDKISILEYGNLHNSTNNGNDTDLWSNVQTENYTNEYDAELTLFNSLMTNFLKNTSVNETNSSNEINMNSTESQSHKIETIFSTEVQTFADKFTEITTQAPAISNEQIYAELIKRIHNITTHYETKKPFKNNYQSIRKQGKQNRLKDFQYSSTEDQQNVLLVIKTIYQNENSFKAMSINTTNKCFISIQFLKLHLLLLVFVIYFLPILCSSMLQQHGKLNCQIILDRLKTKSEMLLNNFAANFANDITDKSFDNSIDSEEVFTPEHIPKNLNSGVQELHRDYNRLEQVGVHSKDSNAKWNKCPFNEDDKNKEDLSVIEEVKNIEMLFKTIKVSLLCGTLLWTPVLTQILFKVFIFPNVAEWSLNITYIAGITFGILRNIFNLKMIKLQETNTNIKKTNSIHPIDPIQD